MSESEFPAMSVGEAQLFPQHDYVTEAARLQLQVIVHAHDNQKLREAACQREHYIATQREWIDQSIFDTKQLDLQNEGLVLQNAGLVHELKELKGIMVTEREAMSIRDLYQNNLRQVEILEGHILHENERARLAEEIAESMDILRRACELMSEDMKTEMKKFVDDMHAVANTKTPRVHGRLSKFLRGLFGRTKISPQEVHVDSSTST